jgi:hypothetical protein
MGRQRTDAEQQIADLRRTARRSLKMSVAFLSRLDGTTQHLEVMESSLPLVFRDGLTQPQETTFCSRAVRRRRALRHLLRRRLHLGPRADHP